MNIQTEIIIYKDNKGGTMVFVNRLLLLYVICLCWYILFNFHTNASQKSMNNM